MSSAEKVVAIALGEVGYREKASNADLDLAAANAGTGNWTKYARDLYEAGYYNGNKNGYEWCDVFVDWCFFKAFGKTEGQLMQAQSGPLGAACPFSAGYYKAQGRYDRTPRVGDQVFYQENGALVHTGIVTAVTGSTITTVEGNRGNAVTKQTRNRSDSYIDGYGHPAYDGAAAETASGAVVDGASAGTAPKDEVTAWQTWLGVKADGEYGPDTRTAAIAKALRGFAAKHPLKSGADGDAVKALQGRLYSLGYDPKGLDGQYGTGTAAAVRAFQEKTGGLDADGQAGEATFAALFGL